MAALNSQKLSYHILIAKDGKAYQTRPFTKTAAHPGRSNWKRPQNVRDAGSEQIGSIGVCLMNMGYAHGDRPHANARLIYNPNDQGMKSWEIYPKAQIEACNSIVADIIGAYAITEVVGHHDVAIMGKFDPGPLFDFAPLNALIASAPSLGLKTTVDAPGGTIPLREDRRGNGKIIAKLPHGTRVHIRSVVYGPPLLSLDGVANTPANKKKRWLTAWASVGLDETNRHAGYVHMKGLAANPLHPDLKQKLKQTSGD
ncbi:N-acetylmuramoyl-L-alanine amidase (plasmid) [Bosea vestrisii]|nr:N-acetylmuramoyl-L-alanine amidase [Bosea vestrisii]WID99686.1 N-acetylmuramoyl-L-alanine amidase [Bosea vestrisii]